LGDTGTDYARSTTATVVPAALADLLAEYPI
jgi:hypothetical protein